MNRTSSAEDFTGGISKALLKQRDKGNILLGIHVICLNNEKYRFKKLHMRHKESMRLFNNNTDF